MLAPRYFLIDASMFHVISNVIALLSIYCLVPGGRRKPKASIPMSAMKPRPHFNGSDANSNTSLIRCTIIDFSAKAWQDLCLQVQATTVHHITECRITVKDRTVSGLAYVFIFLIDVLYVKKIICDIDDLCDDRSLSV